MTAFLKVYTRSLNVAPDAWQLYGRFPSEAEWDKEQQTARWQALCGSGRYVRIVKYEQAETEAAVC